MKNIILIGFIFFISKGYSQTIPASQLEFSHTTDEGIHYRINNLRFFKDYNSLFNVPSKAYWGISDFDQNQELMAEVLDEFQRIIMRANIIHAFALANQDIIELDLNALKHSKLDSVKEELKNMADISEDMRQALKKANKARLLKNEYLCKKSFDYEKMHLSIRACHKTLSYLTLFKTEKEMKRFDKLLGEYEVQKKNNPEFDTLLEYLKLMNHTMIGMIRTNNYSKENFKYKLKEILKYKFTVTQVPTKKNKRQRPIKQRRSHDYFINEFVDLLHPLVSSQARRIVESTEFEDKFESHLKLEESKQYSDDFLEIDHLTVLNRDEPQFKSDILEEKRRKLLSRSMLSYLVELKQKSGKDILKVVTNLTKNQDNDTETIKTDSVNIETQRVIINTPNAQEL